WLSLAIDHALWGMDARGYHFTNVLLHACGAVAFFFLAREILPACSATLRERTLDVASFAAALLFALHPLRAESVAWVTERRDVLSGVFFVLATTSYVRFAASADPHRRRRWRLLALALLFAGLCAKASGITLPVVFVAIDRWLLRRPWKL